ncbi:endonuclease [Mesosutterella sp. OilRF-GAM-744-9]|uniref:Endonuclease n=1 Tax=Mesosutterella porci TaxID=2915351 RepID=A0ABS9MQE8_9BURK|nr:endonuclease [Mesosutterella sp. oilRF-744-WT-GAM-9]MCG5030752.1 endonuclease [Mesosutterella sp. oilRF-744-WT-GAM-9]
MKSTLEGVDAQRQQTTHRSFGESDLKANLLLLPALCLAASGALAAIPGNTTDESFAHAKKTLLEKVFYDHRVTFYCRASFDEHKNITLPRGFTTPTHEGRANRLEWEHIVPAENFGRAFEAWRNGDPRCQSSKGAFKGRRCANLASREYRLMQADYYNLYPAIGAVNAMRSNFPYTQFAADAPATFGTCPMKIEDRRAEPPDWAKGLAARTYKYMAAAYPQFRMSDQQRRLMDVWDKKYPADDWECLRAKRIKALQGNANPFTEESCARRK